MKKEIYLDNSATTKVNKEVMEIVKESFVKNYGNASSQHNVGQKARKELKLAREKIANFIDAEPSEIIFTSGGTESNNLAIKGLALANPNKKHIITSVIEHPSILETCRLLEKQEYKVDYIEVDSEGIVNINQIKEKIKNDTLLVSIMHINNEIGTIQPIEEIAKICHEKDIYFHTDAVQSFTKVNLKVSTAPIDLISVSGHKINAPKGVGFLYIRKNVKISPIITGGGQERGLRSGTENLPGIIGLSKAIDIKVDKEKIKNLRDKIIKELKKIPGTKINGSIEKRVYNNLSVSFYGIEGESLMLMLNQEGIYLSTGSACASTKLQESYVLNAIGVGELYIHGSLRITLGEITEEDANFVIEKIGEKVKKLREISPFKLNLEVKENG